MPCLHFDTSLEQEPLGTVAQVEQPYLRVRGLISKRNLSVHYFEGWTKKVSYSTASNLSQAILQSPET